MPRKARLLIDFPGGLYHIINRGVNRQKIFTQDEDYVYFLQCLQVTQKKFPFKLFSFCLMPNHFHLLLQRTDMPLSRVLSSLLTRFTQHINKKHKRVGHLFQGRSKTILCEKEPYFLELTRYIPLNPVRSKLIENPQDYLWSSYRLFFGYKIPKLKNLPQIEMGEILDHFGSNPMHSLRLFRSFLKGGIKEGHRKDLYPKGFIPILGDKTFIQKVLEEQKIEPQRKPSFTQQIRVPMKTLVEHICSKNQLTLERLRQKTKERNVAQARAWIGYLASRHANMALSKVADYLGVGLGGLSIAAIRLHENIKEKPEAVEKILAGLKQYQR